MLMSFLRKFRFYALFGVFFLIPIVSLNAERMAVLPDILKPEAIAVDCKNIYITDQHGAFIYSLSDFKLLGKIGRKGEGPSEFPHTPLMQILSDKIFLYTFKRMCFYTKSGDLVKEDRSGPMASRVKIVGNNYVVSSHTFEEKIRYYNLIDVYSPNLEKLNTIYKSQGSNFANTNAASLIVRTYAKNVGNILLYYCWDNKIYLVEGKLGFLIKVFDHNGTLLKTIKKDYEKIRIDDEEKKLLLEKLKYNRFVRKIGWDNIKRAAGKIADKYPKYYPAIKDFNVFDDRIYVKTFKRSGEKEEFIVLDLNGNELKRVFLPAAEFGFWTFKKDRFYYLWENEDEEEWELHSEEI